MFLPQQKTIHQEVVLPPGDELQLNYAVIPSDPPQIEIDPLLKHTIRNNTLSSPNTGLMLGQRRRQLTEIKPK